MVPLVPKVLLILLVPKGSDSVGSSGSKASIDSVGSNGSKGSINSVESKGSNVSTDCVGSTGSKCFKIPLVPLIQMVPLVSHILLRFQWFQRF